MKQNTSIKIPRSWIQASLSELFLDPKNNIVDGPFGSNLKASEYQDEGIPVIRIQNIDRNRFIDKNINYVSEEKADFLSRHSFKSGDIIITKLGEPVGKACFVPKKYERGIIVADLIRARIDHKNISDKFLLHQLNSIYLIKQFDKYTKGTTRPRIKLSIVRDLILNLPPLNEQLRIVSKIEELFSELDNGVSNLKLAQNQLKVYRKSLLKYAFDGKFINDKQDKWEIVTINEVGEVITGGTPPKKEPKFYGGIFNFYKPGDLDVGYYTKDSTDKLSPLGYSKSRQAPAKSVLVTCIGATIGKTALIRKEGAFNQQINAIIPNDEFIPEFIYYQIISNEFQQKLKYGSSSTTIPILNKSKFSALHIKKVSLAIQNRIVEHIDEQFSIIDNLELAVERGLQKSEALRQSILKKAFEGKLVLQDPKDEPASELFKRIQAEKKKYLEEQKQQKKRKPKNTRKMSKELSIEEVLKTSDKPMLAKDVWQKSKHKENIEEFYKELKDIQSKIKEVKKGTESLLSLSK